MAKKPVYIGLFLVALATLMYEILLTRIFSVTMWFHFAFIAVSIAMFGMTIRAILVYLNPRFFSPDKIRQRLAMSACFFAMTIIFGFLAHLYIPFVTEVSLKNLFYIGLTYAVITVPFIFSGVCVCLVLTRYPAQQIGRLYAADLAGASLGCLFVIWILGLTDASSAVFFISLLAALGGWAFAFDECRSCLRRATVVCAMIAIAALLHAGYAATSGAPFFRLKLVKGSVEAKPIYEKWNSFSRITVADDPNGPQAFGWGLSSVHAEDAAPEELWLRIDSGAATPMTRFNNDLLKHQYLKYDITNIVHYLRPKSNVLVVGTGGGRDILSAIVFGQQSVSGVEINQAILDTTNSRFGDFTGHLDKYPNVRLINDEARSFIARSKDKFDIIQVSFIDTNAATAAGAFVFTENSLYTVEAWKTFISHLTEDGILTFSRWYYLDLSGEIYRMLTIADEALGSMGFSDIRKHIVCVKNIRSGNHAEVGTFMISRAPFTTMQLRELDRVCRELNFEVILSPEVSKDPVFEKLLSNKDKTSFMSKFHINISPTTDDNPFFSVWSVHGRH